MSVVHISCAHDHSSLITYILKPRISVASLSIVSSMALTWKNAVIRHLEASQWREILVHKGRREINLYSDPVDSAYDASGSITYHANILLWVMDSFLLYAILHWPRLSLGGLIVRSKSVCPAPWFAITGDYNVLRQWYLSEGSWDRP